MSLPEGTPIVVFGDDWGRHVSTMQHTFRYIIPRYPVIWINGIGHRVPRLTLRDLRRASEKVLAVSGSASAVSLAPRDGPSPRIVIAPRVLPWHHWPGVERWNTGWLMRAITQALNDIGAREKPVIVTGSPPSVGVVERLPAAASVYFCMDDFLHHPSATPWLIKPLEDRLLQCVDVVVATAEKLLDLKRPRSGVVEYLPQGVNYSHFAEPRPVPAEFEGLPRPVIGFAGRMSDCCDYAILRAVAEAFPAASIVLVGPISVPDSELEAIRLPNVHLFGPRPYSELPAYVQQFDVGMIPYILSGWTISVNPLKFLEYLAAGVPVVSTPLPEVMRYGDQVRIGGDPQAFVACVRGALTEDRTAVRARGQAEARQHTWEQRATRLLEIIADAAAARAGSPAAA